jgi:hypothetical protein
MEKFRKKGKNDIKFICERFRITYLTKEKGSLFFRIESPEGR